MQKCGDQCCIRWICCTGKIHVIDDHGSDQAEDLGGKYGNGNASGNGRKSLMEIPMRQSNDPVSRRYRGNPKIQTDAEHNRVVHFKI